LLGWHCAGGGAAPAHPASKERADFDIRRPHIANLDEGASHWIKLNADADGSFRITNGRTGITKTWECGGAERGAPSPVK
jgi:hypothetical protein